MMWVRIPSIREQYPRHWCNRDRGYTMKSKIFKLVLGAATFILGIGWSISTALASGVVFPPDPNVWYLVLAVGLLSVFIWALNVWLILIKHPINRIATIKIYIGSLLITIARPIGIWFGQWIR